MASREIRERRRTLRYRGCRSTAVVAFSKIGERLCVGDVPIPPVVRKVNCIQTILVFWRLLGPHRVHGSSHPWGSSLKREGELCVISVVEERVQEQHGKIDSKQ